MTESSKQANTSASLWQRILLILIGTAVAIGIVGGVLIIFPEWVGLDPSARGEAGTTLEVEFRLSDGDYFFYQQGRVRPPEEDTLLASYTISWGEDGFRVPAIQADSYPIVAFGDSFTEGTTVAEPWVDLLAIDLDTPIKNYGYRGYGPHEIAVVAENYLNPDEQQSWILYAHFSGNDLDNANRAVDDALILRNPFEQMAWLTRQATGGSDNARIVESPDGEYDYPMPVIIGSSFYEIALLEDLLWWQVAPEDGFLGTGTFNIVADALDTIDTNAPSDACRAVIFVPSKEQIYYPYIHEDVRQWVRGIARQPVVNSRGTILLEDAPLSAEDEADFIASLDDQRDALRTLAEQEGWLFIDLLEPFQQAALERGLAGESLLYYQYDGHWSPAGHQLATEIIADFMRENAENCPLEVN
ncbi:MAG: hypothetical protein AAF846_20375 [Chloroflexota bacterium]